MKLFFSSSDDGGCGHYRSFLPAWFLQQSGYFDTESFHGFKADYAGIKESDVVILQRHCHPFFLDWIPKARANGQIVLYDIDDSFWHIPIGNPAREMYTAQIVHIIEQIMAACNGVICSTAPLQQVVSKHSTHSCVIPNYIDMPAIEPVPYTDRLKIGFAGSVSHASDFSRDVIKGLVRARDKFDAHIIFMGMVPKGFPVTEDTVIVAPVPPKYYIHQLQLINFDIAIAPLQRHVFNECKSNLKYLEYASTGACTVATASTPYKCIRHMQTGVRIGDALNWKMYIDELCRDRKLLSAIQQAARQDVLENWTWQSQLNSVVNMYKQFISEVR